MSTETATSKPSLHTAKSYHAVIAQLESSTRTIEAHIKATQIYLASTTNPTTTSRSIPQPETQHRHQSRLISSLRQELTDTQNASTECLYKAISTTLTTIDDTLVRHDHAFTRLDQQHCGTSSSSEDDTNINDLLAALAYTNAETIRTRLNRKYLETLAVSKRQSTAIDGVNGYARSNDPGIDAIKTDLGALHAEIPTVAQMLVAHEHGDTLGSLIAELTQAQGELERQRTKQAVEEMRFMTEQLVGIEEKGKELMSRRVLLQRLGGYLDESGVGKARSTTIGNGNGNVEGVTRDVAALDALRRYLGLDGIKGNGSGVRQQQIEQAFQQVLGHVDKALAVQEGQVRLLRSQNSEQDSMWGLKVDEGGDRKESRYAVLLDQIDEEIAVVKNEMEALSG